jgi:hypothetical protein
MTLNRYRVAAWAGIIGPLLFVAVFTIEGRLRPGYSSLSMFVSELSIGPRGWIQIANFIVLGTLLIIFSWGVAHDFNERKLSKTGPILLTIIAIAYLLSGPFVTDLGTIFTAQKSWHGIIHGILGAIVFVLMPISCFVFLRSFRRDSEWRPFRTLTIIAGIVIALAVLVLTVATKFPMMQPIFGGWFGLIQRLVIIPYMLWLCFFLQGSFIE